MGKRSSDAQQFPSNRFCIYLPSKCEPLSRATVSAPYCTNLLQQMFSILNEIGNNSHFRTTSVVFASIGVAGFIYILVAITGYLSFGNAVSGNIVGMCKYIVLEPELYSWTWLIYSARCSVHKFDNRQGRHCCSRYVFIPTSGSPL